MSFDGDLDISWIDKHSKLHTIDKNYCREPMDTISMHCIFISAKHLIEKISSDKIDVVDSKVPKEKILKIIQDNKSMHDGAGAGAAGAKYKLLDIVVYNVDLESQYIQEFVQNDGMDTARFCKICPIVDDIVIMPSIFIFHSLNAIYFMFQEIEVVLDPLIKPILKIGGGDHTKKHTKKVRICEPSERAKNKTKYVRDK